MEVDGNGWFGFTNLSPGRYKLWIESGQERLQARVQVAAGKVARPTGPGFKE
jgi:hypothetical protein